MTTIERLTAANATAAAARTAYDAAATAIPEERLLRRDSMTAAERNVEALRRQFDGEQKAQTARDAVEQSARKKLDTGAKQLDASTRGLAEAVEQARAALEAVRTKAEAHATLIDHWRDELAKLGLGGELRPDGQPQTTTALYRSVKIDGREWVRYSPSCVLAFAVRRGVASDRLLTDRLRGITGLDEKRIADALTH